jgi:hypothetical protein
MSRTYTKREIAYLLKCSVSTVEKNADYLNIKPNKGDRGLNLYSEMDYQLLSQLNEHLKNPANSRDSFVPNTEVEILDIEPAVSKLKLNPQEYQLSVKSFFDEAIEFGLRQDPLFDLELLQRISDRAYLLPATRLAPIVGLSPKYLNDKKIHHHCGFILTREVNLGAKYLWKVSSNRD